MSRPIAVVSHDAGGAEILSSYLRREQPKHVLVLEGPAQRIFAAKLGKAPALVDLKEAVRGANWVLCGTSWQSDLEWRAIHYARELKKRSVAFLDHWINYSERFVRDGEVCLPDEIWVGDQEALRIASGIFKPVPIRLKVNPYFEDLRRDLAALRPPRSGPAGAKSILYVCEPIRAHALFQHGDERHWGYVEEEALEYFINNISAVTPQVGRVVVRPHPSEPKDKYDWIVSRTQVPIEFSRTTTLAQDVAAADIVAGCESMAMVVGLLGGKRVVSVIPPGGRACVLPQPEIEVLRDMVLQRTA